MMDLELTRIFVKVAQNSSFTRAAEILKVPKSTVSKAVSRLESETGTKLIIRTTRSLTLTAAGRAFYDSSLGPILILEDAQKSLYGQDSMLAGMLRLTAPEDVGVRVVAPAIATLTAQHPALNFELNYTDSIVDLVKDGFDLAVRVGRVNESSFKVKKIGELDMIMVASKTYLKNRGKIIQPKDLEDHDCLSFSDKVMREKWMLRSAKSKVQVNVNARIVTNQMTSLLSTAAAGGGVALIPRFLCKDDLDEGKIVQVLPEWATAGMAVSIVSPLGSSSSARLKITIDTIAAHLLSAIGTGKRP